MRGLGGGGDRGGDEYGNIDGRRRPSPQQPHGKLDGGGGENGDNEDKNGQSNEEKQESRRRPSNLLQRLRIIDGG